MTGKKDEKIEVRKTWVAPELKKTSIEQITAASHGSTQNDGNTHPGRHDS
ncbi:MAG: hypothetical protein ABSD59_10035 [Terracidiphilus sp.]|jgi:hypothetical protein